MISLVKGLPLNLYLTLTNKSIGTLLAQEVEGVERPVYNLSRLLQGVEMSYPPIECHWLATIFATNVNISLIIRLTWWLTRTFEVSFIQIILIRMNCSMASATCQTCWISSLLTSTNSYMKTYHVQKYVSWRPMNEALYFMDPPLIKAGGQLLCYMILTKLVSLCFSNSISPVRTMLLSMTLWS